ncbi:MAG: MFS transporter [Dehalococcoidia bacterium]|nr:MFS transporter [Dehalococcoidia bacterium]
MIEPPKEPATVASDLGRSGFIKSTFASIRYRDFAYLWFGQNAHGFAIWIDMIAQPLLVLFLTDSPVHLGMVLLARTVPGIALGPLGGAMADGFNRRAVLLLSKVAILLVSMVFAAALLFDTYALWTVYVYAVLRGATMAFDMPARRAMIPSIVPRELVTNAMALSTWSMTVTRIAGAAVSGYMVAFIGFGSVYVVVCAMYAGAVFFTWKMRLPDHKPEGYQGIRSMGSETIDGLRYVWQTPPIRAVVTFAFGYFTFGMAFMQVFAPLFATREDIFNIGDGGFGTMMAVSAIGGTMGALGLAAANPHRRRGIIMIGVMGAFGLLLMAFALSAQINSVILGFVVMFMLGIGQSSFQPLINSVAVELTPDNMRGRVIGVISLDRATIALGGAIAGVLAGALNPVIAQALFGLVCVATAAVFFLGYPTLRKID